MAKGQLRGNREAKKPKQEKKVSAAAVASFGPGAAKPQPSFAAPKKKA